ncbi:hypothetical protein V494_02684 [Pseudogymnoascus sp. VKM F-4513 (FW-928)]|nr:hypothetical protein V494_02684 [Pseudogymnoascus sp. VKM F-4513 (FW-928)]
MYVYKKFRKIPATQRSCGLSAHHGSAAGLNRLDLRLGVWGASEASGQLAAVEELTLGSGDGAEVTAGNRADLAVAADVAAEGAVLLCVLAVCGEGGGALAGKGGGWGGWVDGRSVVNGGWGELDTADDEIRGS